MEVTITLPIYAILIIAALLTGILFLGIYTVIVMRNDVIKAKEDLRKYSSNNTPIEMPEIWKGKVGKKQLN